jgi:Luciferase-like monooxygenase
MDFGFSLPPRGPMATPENITTLAQQGEAMGFGIIAATDHIIFPTSIQSTYPGSASGQYYAAGDSQGEYLEALALLSFLAGITSTVKLLTAVMVIPNRPPILTAKTLATIDVLSRDGSLSDAALGGCARSMKFLAPRRSRSAAPLPMSISAPSESFGRTTRQPLTALTAASAISCSRRSQCKSRIHPSGPAAKARRRCAGRDNSPTDGIPSRTTRMSP